MNTPPDMSYEAARDELAETVRNLESGGAGLAESIQMWQRAEELARICRTWLDGAQTKLDGARPDAGTGPAS